MFDTMTMTKIVGGFCGMFLVFLLGNWAAESLYHTGTEGHGGERHQAYSIDTGSEDENPVEETDTANAPDFTAIYASADAAAGEKLFKACKACHKTEDGKNAVGPFLYGVVGRPVQSIDGFKYSGALGKVADSWDPATLNHFLENPKAFAPGTKMTYKGMKDIGDRANLIAYLDGLDD